MDVARAAQALRNALPFLYRQHSTNIQYAIDNIQSLKRTGMFG